MIRSVRHMLMGTLRARLVFTVAMVHSLMVIVLVVHLGWEEREIFLDEGESAARGLGRAIASSSAGPLVSHDVAGLQDLIEAQQAYPGCLFLIITDEHGRILAHTDKAKRGLTLAELPPAGAESVYEKTSGLVDLVFPIFVGSDQVGWVRVGISQASVQEKLEHVFFDGVLFILITSIFGAALAWFMSIHVTRRFDAIASTINRVRDGDSSARSNLTGEDDAASIGAAIDRMLDELRDRDARLLQEQARFRVLFDESPAGVLVKDISSIKRRLDELIALGVSDVGSHLDRNPDEIPLMFSGIRVLEVNRRAMELLKTKDIVAFMPEFDRHFIADNQVVLKSIMESLGSGRTIVQVPAIFTDAEGGKLDVELGVAIQPGYEQSFARVMISFLDITERRRVEAANVQLENQLQQAQKIESVGRLAGGMAHDFNNMLSVILGHAELALREVSPGGAAHGELLEIRTAVSRSANIIRQLLAFARKQTVTPKVLDLNESIPKILTMLSRLIGENITLDWSPVEGLWPVKIDPTQIEQVLTNLCVNSRDAITDVGRVVITMSNVRLDSADCRNFSGCTPGEYVMISVTDDGCGMDDETMANIFEPFFTTKGVGKGTGLGLSTVYGIMKQNKGCVSVESSPGRGSTFRLYFPRSMTAPSPKLEFKTPEVVPNRGVGTILLVEDEPAILALVSRMLEIDGYSVHAFASANGAIGFAESMCGKIDMLITDVVMPEMNGRDLSEMLRARQPGLRCLFMSGHTAEIISRNGEINPGLHFIQKPFRAAELSAKVREIMEINRV